MTTTVTFDDAPDASALAVLADGAAIVPPTVDGDATGDAPSFLALGEGSGGGGGGIVQDVLMAAGGILGRAGQGMAALIAIEQHLSAIAGAIPFPALPALRVLDLEVGFPHGHWHPPNFIPPFIPAPIPLPAIGPVLPIPLFSGATTVTINGQAAARCGDMGASIWCGSYFPLFEIFLGSCNVWVESGRAARAICDITTHCIFAAPKPQDPPVYPWLGMPVQGSGDVLIGGVPLPSLLSMAMGALFKGLFNGFSKILRRIKSERAVRRFLSNIEVQRSASLMRGRGVGLSFDVPTGAFDDIADMTDDVYEQLVKDLRQIASTPQGRALLQELYESKFPIRIEPGEPRFIPDSGVNAHVVLKPDDAGDYQLWSFQWVDNGQGGKTIGGFEVPAQRYSIERKGSGSGGVVRYGPTGEADATSAEGLMHELTHARNATQGNMMAGANVDGTYTGNGVIPHDPDLPEVSRTPPHHYMSLEEQSAVTEGEDVIRVLNGKDPRDGY